MTGQRGLRAVPDKPTRVVLYARVSALMGREGDGFHSPDVQVGAMRRITAGMREIGVVEDIDRTGRNFDRRGIKKIRRMAEQGQIDALAVYDVSRLGRNVRESLTFLAEMADLGVTILSACEHIDTSEPAGRLMLTNMLAIAEYRSDEIGRSWSAVIARRAERGINHTVPFGYERDPQTRRLAPHPVFGAVAAKAWRDYANGVPVSKITWEVADARGCHLQTSNLKTMFRRPVYLGHVTSHGVIVARDAHPALVDQQTWDRVQERLLRDSSTPPRLLEVSWSLTQLVYCPCGARLVCNPAWRKGVREIRLVCSLGPGRGVAAGCAGIGGPLLDRVEAEVLRQAAEYVRELRYDLTAQTDLLVRQRTAVADKRAVSRRLKTVRDGLARLAKAWALGDLADDEYQAAGDELRAERDALQVQLADLTDVEEQPPPEKLATMVEEMLAFWPEMDAQQRNRALKVVIDRVVVRRADRWREPEADRVKVHWR